MANDSSRPNACPRCSTPVTGDYKFCPTCACRLRATDETPTEPPRRVRDRWPLALVTLLLGLLAVAFLLLGLKIFPSPHPPPPSNGSNGTEEVTGVLTVQDLLDLFVNLNAATALDWPSTNPLRPYKPLKVGDSRVTKYEVTRGMYAEYLEDCRLDPERIPAFLVDLWRPPRVGEQGSDEGALQYAAEYIDVWWDAYRRHVEEDPDATADRPADFVAPFPERYGNLLSVPPSWVFIDEYGEFAWRIPPDADADVPENLPVTGVSWWDAVAFAAWASERLGVTCRLPTDMEWVRAGNDGDPKKTYPWGTRAWRKACNNWNYWGEGDTPRLHVVYYRYSDKEGKTPSGIWGMSGNAREWTHNSDLIERAEDFYTDLTSETERTEMTAPTFGGSYLEGIGDCTLYSSGEQRAKSGRWPEVGFRLWMRGWWGG